MTRGILIIGNTSTLLAALGREAAKRVDTYAVSVIPDGITIDRKRASEGTTGAESGVSSPPKNQIRLDWNPSSPISARTVILQATSALEHIDDAILVCAPPACRRPPEELAPAEIDRIIDNNVKGWFFLIKELCTVFKNRKQGSLSLVLSEFGSPSRGDSPDLLGTPAVSAFRAFSQGILGATINKPYAVMGFSSSDPAEDDSFAPFIFKTIDEGKKNSGKWHKFGRMGIFGR